MKSKLNIYSINKLSFSFYLKFVVSLIAFFYVADLIMHNNIISIDFKTYYFAGAAILNDENFYDIKHLNILAGEAGTPVVYPYLYPPFLAFIMSPLSYLSPFQADKLWGVILCSFVAIIVFTAVSIGNLYFNSKTKTQQNLVYNYFTPFIAILLVIILPFRYNIVLGQINIILLAFLFFILVFHLKNRPAIVAFFLSLCIFIKVTPALLLLYFLIRKEYKIISYTFLFAVLLVVLSLALGAWQSWQSFLHFLPQTSYGSPVEGLFSLDHPRVFSISSFFERLIGKKQAIISLFTWAAELIMLIFIFIQSRKLNNKELLLLPLLILMIVASPITYIHHLIFLMPGLFILLLYICKNFFYKERKIFFVIILVLSMLICTDFPRYYIAFKNIFIFNLLARTSFFSLNLFFLVLLFVFSLYINNIVIQRQKEKNELIAT